MVDEGGNIVHERELTADEIIEELLTPPQKVAKEEHIEEPAPAPPVKVKGSKPSKYTFKYDKQAVIDDLVSGKLNAQEIAEKHGITKTSVYTLKYAAKKRGLIKEEPGWESVKAPVEKKPDPARNSFKEGLKRASKINESGEPANIRVLTETEFDLVKDLKENTMKTSLQIASEIGEDIQLQQVNYAILAPTYDIYLKNSERGGGIN